MSLSTFDREHVDRFARRFEELFDNGDAAAMAAYYIDDAEVTAPDTPVVRGRSGIEAFFKAACDGAAKTGMKRTIEIRHVESSGHLGYVLSKVSLDMPRPNGERSAVEFHDVTVWRRCEDARWRMVADSANRTSANPGAAAPAA